MPHVTAQYQVRRQQLVTIPENQAHMKRGFKSASECHLDLPLSPGGASAPTVLQRSPGPWSLPELTLLSNSDEPFAALQPML